MIKNYINIFFLFTFGYLQAQKEVAFTFDDLPCSRLGESILLKKIDSLQLPSAIFINEQKLTQDEGYIFNKRVLDNWIKNPLITAGNHTYSHARASTSSFTDYEEEINNGEILTRQLCEKHGKTLHHFRFPYNDLGRDSLHQDSLESFLNSKEYRIAPFTIESSDWMFNSVYRKYIKEGKYADAKRIGQGYVDYTLSLFNFYDSMCISLYGRNIKQIYLCHDNEINRDYIAILFQRLKENNYSFITFDQALTDPVYSSNNYYHKKYGISWLYRWIPTLDKRMSFVRLEPSITWLEKEYETLNK